MRIIGIFLFIQYFVLGHSFAREYQDFEYPFPYKDASFSTVTSGLFNLLPPDGKGIGHREYSLRAIRGRDKLPFLNGKKALHFSFFYDKNISKKKRLSRPLVFIISGIGGAHSVGTASFLATTLAKSGSNVITISSPFNRFFSVFRSTGAPGISVDDARDLHGVMAEALEFMREQKKLAPREISLLGFSLGGLEAAFVARLDEMTLKTFNFKKVVVINPPVDLATSVSLLDQFFNVFASLSSTQKKDLETKSYRSSFKLLDMEKKLGADIYYRLKGIARFYKKELRALIGLNFRRILSESLFYSSMIYDLDLVAMPLGKSPKLALENLFKISFEKYYEEILLPSYKGPKSQMIRENSFYGLTDYLNNSAIDFYLFHNRDDIILGVGDLDFLASLFKEDNRFIYPFGGHLGNLWFPQNLRDLANIFSD